MIGDTATHVDSTLLILPPGHAQSVAAPRRLARRERWMIGAVLGLVALGAIALVISFASGSKSSSNGCIHVTVQYVTGATQLDKCGREARSVCSSIGQPGGYAGALAEAIARECRKADLPVAR